MQYTYTVSDPATGRRSSGTLVAPDYESAFRILTERNFIVTRLASSQTRRKLLDWLGVKQRVSEEQLLALTQQVAAMLRAGLTVKASFEIVLNDAVDERFRHLLLEMSTELGAGESLTEVLSRRPAVFSKQYVALVSAGESGGKLAEVMGRLAALIESSTTLRKKVQSALYYPLFVLVFAAVVLVGLLVFGVPRFADIYRTFGGELPPLTRIFIGLGTFLGKWGPALLAAVALLAVMTPRVLRIPRVAEFIDLLMLRLPVVGPLTRHLAIARFSRTLGTLHASGVGLIHSLELVANSMDNRVLEKVVLAARNCVMEGESLLAPLRRSGWFTEMSLSMIGAGEHSGALDEMLADVADYYEFQVEAQLRALVSLIEPAVMIVVGVIVGVILLALILPIFNLSQMIIGGPAKP